MQKFSFFELNSSGYRYSSIICFRSAGGLADFAFPDLSSLIRDMSQSFLVADMTVLRYIACECRIIVQVFASHCSGRALIPVECRTVFPLRQREILMGAGVPDAFALVSRYSFVVAIACRCICRRSGATWCKLIQKSATHRFFERIALHLNQSSVKYCIDFQYFRTRDPVGSPK